MADVTQSLANLGSAGWVTSSAITGNGGRRYGADSMSAVNSQIRNFLKIASGVAALRNAGSVRSSLVWLGHSVISAVGSDNTSNTDFTAAQTWRTAGLAAKLCDALNIFVGGAGSYGIETLALGHSGYFTLGGGLAINGPFNLAGIAGYVLPFNLSTHTASITVATGASAIKVYGYTGTVGTALRYQINGGSVVMAPAAVSNPTAWSGGSQHWYDTVITGVTAGDVVTILGPTANTFRVYAVDRDYKTSPGITVHRASYAGLMGAQAVAGFLGSTDTQPSGNWVSDADEANYRLMQTQSITTRLGANLVLCTFDVNDMKAFATTGTAWGWSLALIKSHMKNFVQMLASQGLPVLIVAGPLRDPVAGVADGNPYTQAEIIQVYRDVSDEEPNCAFFDWTLQFAAGSLDLRYSSQQATNLIVDTVHPNPAGHIFFATQLATQLITLMAAKA